jgi:signal peptidase II
MAEVSDGRVRPGAGWLSLNALVLVFLIDRLHKVAQIHLFGWKGGEAISVAPFFDYVLVWNTGVSYGLFAGVPVAALIAAMAVAAVGLGFWWFRTESALTRWGLAFALGGAFGNIVDRLVYGAVADFFSLHAMGVYFYIFNLADVGISVGLLLLVIDMVRPRRRRAA